MRDFPMEVIDGSPSAHRSEREQRELRELRMIGGVVMRQPERDGVCGDEGEERCFGFFSREKEQRIIFGMASTHVAPRREIVRSSACKKYRGGKAILAARGVGNEQQCNKQHVFHGQNLAHLT